jgi:hypothetical protein
VIFKGGQKGGKGTEIGGTGMEDPETHTRKQISASVTKELEGVVGREGEGSVHIGTPKIFRTPEGPKIFKTPRTHNENDQTQTTKTRYPEVHCRTDRSQGGEPGGEMREGGREVRASPPGLHPKN